MQLDSRVLIRFIEACTLNLSENQTEKVLAFLIPQDCSTEQRVLPDLGTALRFPRTKVMQSLQDSVFRAYLPWSQDLANAPILRELEKRLARGF